MTVQTEEKQRNLKPVIIVVVLLVLGVGGFFTWRFVDSKVKETNGFRFYTHGTVAMTNNNLEDAVTNYRQSVDFDPEGRADSWVGLAKAYHLLDQPHNAVAALEEASKVKFRSVSDKAMVFTELGHAYYYVSEYAKAIPAYREAIATSPQNRIISLAYPRLVMSYLRMGDHSILEESGDLLTQGRNLEQTAGNWKIHHFARGWVFEVRGMTEFAVQAYRESLSFDDRYPPALQRLGMMEFAEGKVLDAFIRLRRAARNATPDHPGIAEDLAIIGAHLDTMPAAERARIFVEAGHRYFQADPQNVEAATELYELAIGAAPDLALMARVYPRLAMMQLNVRDSSVQVERAPEAIKAAEKGLSLADNDADRALNYTVMSWAYRLLGQPQKAIETGLKASELNPNSRDAWYHLALVYQVQEMFYEAMDAVNKIQGYDRDATQLKTRLESSIRRLEQAR